MMLVYKIYLINHVFFKAYFVVMNRPTEGAKDNITSEGGKPLLKAKKQDFLFGAGINAEAQNQQPTASTGRINKSATVN
jgi:hypothetical protein